MLSNLSATYALTWSAAEALMRCTMSWSFFFFSSSTATLRWASSSLPTFTYARAHQTKYKKQVAPLVEIELADCIMSTNKRQDRAKQAHTVNHLTLDLASAISSIKLWMVGRMVSQEPKALVHISATT